MARAYGSRSSLFGLQRRPWAGSYGPDDAVAVALAGPDSGHEAVPDAGVLLRSGIWLLSARGIEEAQRDAVGDARGHGEVGAVGAGMAPAGMAGPAIVPSSVSLLLSRERLLGRQRATPLGRGPDFSGVREPQLRPT